MIDALHGLPEAGSQQESEQRHQGLSAAEPQSREEKMLRLQFFHGEAFAHRDGESIHGEADSQ
ncbi:hypothetical protein SDC9_171364 [bioreactor metagenome]|uniref:Uncharacterized protein n=1 Tax=bioreactor metagenome TaxID=1076179 RepID=A0A645GAP4_9ZZZZ